VFCAAIGLKAILLPNGFLDGGVTGVSLLVSSITGWDISFLILLINLPFLAMAYKTISKTVFWKSLAAIVLLSVLVHIDYQLLLTEDKFLIAVFGGLFLGLGIGLTIRVGAVLDGTEVLGILLARRYGVTIGSVILTFNIILFSIVAIIAEIDTALYSIITYLVTSKVTDFVIEGFDDYIGINIISKKNTDIKNEMTADLGLGVTVYKGYGGYNSDAEYMVLATVINRIDISKVYSIIDKHDSNAFCYEFDVNKIRGGVLKKYITNVH
jgi:uncharacterized membrane-anchored protein YitT (DUF2179 family)